VVNGLTEGVPKIFELVGVEEGIAKLVVVAPNGLEGADVANNEGVVPAVLPVAPKGFVEVLNEVGAGVEKEGNEGVGAVLVEKEVVGLPKGEEGVVVEGNPPNVGGAGFAGGAVVGVGLKEGKVDEKVAVDGFEKVPKVGLVEVGAGVVVPNGLVVVVDVENENGLDGVVGLLPNVGFVVVGVVENEGAAAG
jgi:hypothetical protein